MLQGRRPLKEFYFFLFFLQASQIQYEISGYIISFTRWFRIFFVDPLCLIALMSFVIYFFAKKHSMTYFIKYSFEI